MPRYRGFILRAESRVPTSVGGLVGRGRVDEGGVRDGVLVLPAEPRGDVATGDRDQDQEPQELLAGPTVAAGLGLLDALLGVIQHACHVHQPPRVNGGMPNVFYIMISDLSQLFDTHKVLKSCYNNPDAAIYLSRKITKQAFA